MPIENELKFVLNKGIIQELINSNFRNEKISQGYLVIGENFSLRIRETIGLNETQYFLTYKHFLKNRLIELENKIVESEQEIIDLWEVCKNKLTKKRYSFERDGNLWSIDLFYDANEAVYFVLMEVEFSDPNQKDPGEIPFSEYLLFSVPRNDDRFSNTKLSDVEYAKRLYFELDSIIIVRCQTTNDNVDLVVGELYRVLPDAKAKTEGYLRVIDRSNEDYLYPASYFTPIEFRGTNEI